MIVEVKCFGRSKVKVWKYFTFLFVVVDINMLHPIPIILVTSQLSTRKFILLFSNWWPIELCYATAVFAVS